jgi:hypothetical protein
MSKVISIPVDFKTAITFNNLPLEERNKLEIFLGLQLESVLKSRQSLLEIMDEISEEAKAKGLTPEILDSLLQDE